ncbi:MAG: hypothetical protein DRO00_08685 [Thermoproteota archaeon]|nr:MAG: hypothetical protein DRO00_08685 [Candidatus Korarchaeota archaeon]
MPELLEPLAETGYLIHLALVSVFALLYAKRRSVVLLPAIMFASLMCSFLGLQAHEVLISISPLAAALIVFVAGLELDVETFMAEKEKLFLMFSIEVMIFLSLFYLLSITLGGPISLALVAIMVASNEMFVLELKKVGDERLANFGIALSVLEDSLAVFLLSIGFFTEKSLKGIRIQALEALTITALLIPTLYLFAKPFSRYIKDTSRLDARIFSTILYIFVLTSIGHALHVPEAIPVFIGALMLSIYGFDKETFESIEHYLMLALLGFISSLPFSLEADMGSREFLMSMGYGFMLALAAFMLRGLMLLISSILAGFTLEEALKISLTLANTGEFGLIVLAGMTRILPPTVVFAAMFAYAFNLTLESEVTLRVEKLVPWLISKMPRKLAETLKSLSSQAAASLGDPEFKGWMYGAIVRLILIYVLLTVSKLLPPGHKLAGLVFAMFSMGAFISTIQHTYTFFERHILSELSEFERVESSFFLILRLLLTYMALAPVMDLLETLIKTEEGLWLPLSSPISLIGMFVTAYLVNSITNWTIKKLMRQSKSKETI